MTNALIIASIGIGLAAITAVVGFFMTRNDLFQPTSTRPQQGPFSSQSNDNRENRTQNVCRICQHDLTGCSPRYLSCGHGFHANCIGTWLRDNKRCPNCNRAA